MMDEELALIETILGDVRAELFQATAKFGPFNSAHEGYAVIKEEFDELWEEIKANDGDGDDARSEAIQVAAMAIRYVRDLCITTVEPAEVWR